jgi:hypothetical protein
MQKLNYIHQNPVRAGLVERAIDLPVEQRADLGWLSLGE